jgi:hypothetical protein
MQRKKKRAKNTKKTLMTEEILKIKEGRRNLEQDKEKYTNIRKEI